MKSLLLTSSTLGFLAAVGSCAGDQDTSGTVYESSVTPTASTPGSATNDPADTSQGDMTPPPMTSDSGPATPMPGVAPTTSAGPGPNTPSAGGSGPGPAPTMGPVEPAAFCGDGTVDPGEDCDDGDRVAANGCENDCTETPPPPATCGDMAVDPGEDCDDGNMEAGDGCESNCTITPPPAVCGDGTQDPGEACDDGDMDPGDGCESDCTLTPPPEPVCGNSMPEEGEVCDDGNMTPGDGCEADCTETPMSTIPTVADLFPAGDSGSLDGRYSVSGCGENTSGTDCASDGAYANGQKITCENGELDVQQDFPVGGTAGTTYMVTMHFYGIMEPKDYGQGVTREAPQRPGNQDDGSDPTTWATAPAGYSYPGSDYNTYELHVDDENMEEVAIYYMNADTSQGHWTYVINYEKQIPIIGGGRVRARVYDRNCRQIKNCGSTDPGSASACPERSNARIQDLSAADPAPPNSPAPDGLQQPNLLSSRDASNAGQWWLVDVVSVDSME